MQYIRTPIKVLSLRDAGDRRDIFTGQARDAPSWTFFDAWEKLSDDLVYDEAGANLRIGRSLSSGELGCYASHFMIWKDLLSSEFEQYMVLEDDVIADWDLITELVNLDFRKSGIDYLRLYHIAPCASLVRRRNFLHRNRFLIELLGVGWGTQGYVITRGAAQRFIDTSRTVVRPIDDHMDRFWEHGIPNLCIFPFPILERAIPSTVGASRGSPVYNSPVGRLFQLHDKLARRLAVRSRKSLDQSWPLPVAFSE